MSNTCEPYEETCLVEVASKSVWQQLKNAVVSDQDDSTTSTSGLLISPQHGYVLTHGSILLNFLSKKREILKRLNRIGHIPSKTFQGLQALVTLDRKKEKGFSDGKSHVTSLFNLTSSSTVDSRHDQVVGTIELVWKANRIAKALKDFLPSSNQWSFFEESYNSESKDSKKDDIDPDLIAELLPYFVLIKLEKWKNKNHTKVFLYDEQIAAGDTVHIVGTPFGSMSPSVFMNSVSQGIVCNVAGQHQELIVTDARCIPGTEGGPIYYGPANNRHCLLGIVLSALCWKANEWIGLSLICNISEIIHSLSEVLQLPQIADSIERVRPMKSAISSSNIHQNIGMTPDMLPVVLVKNGGVWGSGIIVDQSEGLVLTCGHVVKNDSRNLKVRVDTPNVEWYDSEVLYATPVNHAFDIGVLLLKKYQSRRNWPNRIGVVQNPREGDAGFVVGHAMFGPHLNLKPTVTSGIVSKVIRSEGSPVIVQSTCTVNAGASGGPLVSENGNVIGIVTCNARDTGTGASYPHVNLSVPLQTIWTVILQYLETSDRSVLDTLLIKNEDINNLWSMNGSKRNFEGIPSKL